MENNNNGRGIFYGVIGVATLVVAMIGATFAYFSAEATTGPAAIAANSTKVELQLESAVTTGLNYGLVPLAESDPNLAKGGYVGISTEEGPRKANCVDDNGNEFCSVYTFTIKNPSTVAQTVFASMTVAENTFEVNGADSKECKENATGPYCNKTNFAFAIFKGTAADVTGTQTGWNLGGTKVATYYAPDNVTTATKADGTATTVTQDTAIQNKNVNGTAVLGKAGDLVVQATGTTKSQEIDLPELNQTLAPGGTLTYTVVMWLHESNEDQENDMEKQFAAGITFTTSDGTGGVTAVLSASGT